MSKYFKYTYTYFYKAGAENDGQPEPSARSYDNYITEKTFTNEENVAAAEDTSINFLDLTKYCAELFFDLHADDEDPRMASLNTDYLDVVLLLPLLPADEIEGRDDLSDATKKALAEMQDFKALITLEYYSVDVALDLLKTATSGKMSKSIPAQVGMMCWILALVSKISGVQVYIEELVYLLP